MYRGRLVVLRPFTERELDRYLEWVNNSELCSLLGRARPVTPQEHRRWYDTTVGRQDNVMFSIHTIKADLHVGNVWLWNIHDVNRTGELRVLLGEGLDKGCGTEACQLLLEFAFRRLNLNKVYLYVLASNLRARRSFEKAGFREEGLLREEFYVEGAYRDVYRMGAFATD